MDLIEQKKFLHKFTFDFRKEGFEYFAKDRSGEKKMFIQYDELDISRIYTLIERNEYFRNVGFLWLVLGAVMFSSGGRFWLMVGVLCLLIYYGLTTKYFVVPFSRGNIFVVNDQKAQIILDRMKKEYRTIILDLYGQIDLERTFEEEKKKYKTLLDKGIINESEFHSFLEQMEEQREKFHKPRKTD